MSLSDEFYTLKGYQMNEVVEITTAMEDYLEMIYRLFKKNSKTRVNDLSRMLNVKPSSVTKMVQQLNELGYVSSEKYGQIELTEQGRALGEYLLYRHEVIHNFLCLLNQSNNELEQVEKIEHFLNRKTVENLNRLTLILEEEVSKKG
ncbi:transcriptional regulator MntR [Anaerotignum neopropionicum]|uniref:Transcriptional regulator MntR n=1 Tax=Anaerotignum neopropionicum TaxID=36847 RepID=A0A136WFE6_9FIRM|nr:iron dependent repressor, metal binding and dimerization domain protein [Anaerotignum neopropionicum]KXL53224.1 transcriptional regulator MntR [Anaerotignum neopropionicum]